MNLIDDLGQPQTETTDTEDSAASGTTWWKTTGGIVLVVVLIALCNPFAGGATYHVASDNVLSSTSYGVSYGSSKVYASAGQSIELSCEATVEHGFLAIRVWRHEFLPTKGRSPLRKLEIHRTGTESCKVPIAESGLYRIDISPWRDRGRYDIDYDVSWRVK